MVIVSSASKEITQIQKIKDVSLAQQSTAAQFVIKHQQHACNVFLLIILLAEFAQTALLMTVLHAMDLLMDVPNVILTSTLIPQE